MYLSEGSLLQGGKYQIVRFIASGGFGCTYEAYHPMLDMKVAIKEFFPKSLCNRDFGTSHVSVGTISQKPLVEKLKRKFIKEARSIAQLFHPGIVRVRDVFEENGTAYYVMDYIEGLSLDKIIDKKGWLTEDESLYYIRQVCDALQYVHSQNILHLDIKPGNIMIDKVGRAKLIDFGASKQYDEENGENTSTLIGQTPGFSPIEQMGNDLSRFRPATDIYSLGATLYKCLSGITPLAANLLVQGEELEPLPSHVSDTIKTAIMAAMNVSPKNRPQSIKDFVELLNQPVKPVNEQEAELFNLEEEQTEENPIEVLEPIEPTIEPIDESEQVNSDKDSQESSTTEGSLSSDQDKKLSTDYTDVKIEQKDPIKGSTNTAPFPVSANQLDSSEKAESYSRAFSLNNQQSTSDLEPNKSNNINVGNLEEEQKAKSCKTKIFIGAALLAIIALICWMGFGGKGLSTNSDGTDGIAMLGDSIEDIENLQGTNSLTEGATSNADVSSGVKLQIVAPSSVLVGEEFNVVYKLSGGNGEDFNVKDIPGCTKISGPVVSEIKNGTEYTYTYKAESEGTFTIPKATLKVEDKSITSNTLKFSVRGELSGNATDPESINNSSLTTGKINGHEWVDLGLPSGLKWATCNIDATAPERNGSYFAWGETTPKFSYDTNNCETYVNRPDSLKIKGFIGDKGNLTLAYDAARQNWGGTWRMPTKKEIEELLDNTTTEWTTLNGVNGRLVKSQKNENSIFLPAAGYIYKSFLNEDREEGYYWSSSHCSFSEGYILYFQSGTIYSSSKSRYLGFPVRPVSQ